MKNINWDKVPEATDYKPLPVGAYICGILRAVDVPEKEYLRIEFDIAEGDFKNYYRQQAERKPDWKWGGVLYMSYKESALGLAKRFLNALKESNPGFVYDNDESKLSRKKFGLVVSEKEYEKRDGSIGTRPDFSITGTYSVADIREGHFTIPPKKLLTTTANQTSDFAPVADDEDLPF